MNWRLNPAEADILHGVQLAELGISLTIMIVQRAKLIEGESGTVSSSAFHLFVGHDILAG
jgi:hypothetical protein